MCIYKMANHLSLQAYLSVSFQTHKRNMKFRTLWTTNYDARKQIKRASRQDCHLVKITYFYKNKSPQSYTNIYKTKCLLAQAIATKRYFNLYIVLGTISRCSSKQRQNFGDRGKCTSVFDHHPYTAWNHDIHSKFFCTPQSLIFSWQSITMLLKSPSPVSAFATQISAAGR